MRAAADRNQATQLIVVRITKQGTVKSANRDGRIRMGDADIEEGGRARQIVANDQELAASR